MSEYKIGIYLGSKKDEKILSKFIGEDTIVEIWDVYDIFYCVEDVNVTFITRETYRKLNLKYNDKIPSGEPVLENYKLPRMLVVVVDAKEQDELCEGFIDWKMYQEYNETGILKTKRQEVNIARWSEEWPSVLMAPRLELSVDRYFRINYLLGHRDFGVIQKRLLFVLQEVTYEGLINEAVCLDGGIGYFYYVKNKKSEGDYKDRFFECIEDAFNYIKVERPWEKYYYVIVKVKRDFSDSAYIYYYNEDIQLVGCSKMCELTLTDLIDDRILDFLIEEFKG